MPLWGKTGNGEGQKEGQKEHECVWGGCCFFVSVWYGKTHRHFASVGDGKTLMTVSAWGWEKHKREKSYVLSPEGKPCESLQSACIICRSPFSLCLKTPGFNQAGDFSTDFILQPLLDQCPHPYHKRARCCIKWKIPKGGSTCPKESQSRRGAGDILYPPDTLDLVPCWMSCL